MFEKELRRYDVPQKGIFEGETFTKALSDAGVKTPDDLMALIGYGTLSAKQLLGKLVPIDRVIDELGQDLQIEEVGEALAGQIVIDIRHPDAAEDDPLELAGIEVQTMPFYAVNARFKELDPTRQYLLYCDKGVMSRLHAHHLLSEGHANVRVYRPS